MSGWTAKRFWKTTAVVEDGDAFSVELDGRPVRTPLKKALRVPTRGFADAIAGEWDAQEEVVDPTSMPFTRAANAALDKVAAQRQEVCEMLAAYAETDLLCYRATGPEGLVQRQADGWDSHLAWAAERYVAPLEVTAGIVPVAQSEDSLARFLGELQRFSEFELTGFHDLVAISGSLILALAVVEGRIEAAAAYELSRIDELWQIEQWGADEEASELAERKRFEFLRAHQIMLLSQVQK